MNYLNKKAQYNYIIHEKFEAGIILEGWEVKAIKNARVQIEDAYCMVLNNKIYAYGIKITPQPHIFSSIENINLKSNRAKELLFHKKEIIKLSTAVNHAGKYLIIIEMYLKNNKIKALLAISTGKKKYDKRITIKNREQKIEILGQFKKNKHE